MKSVFVLMLAIVGTGSCASTDVVNKYLQTRKTATAAAELPFTDTMLFDARLDRSLETALRNSTLATRAEGQYTQVKIVLPPEEGDAQQSTIEKFPRIAAWIRAADESYVCVEGQQTTGTEIVEAIAAIKEADKAFSKFLEAAALDEASKGAKSFVAIATVPKLPSDVYKSVVFYAKSKAASDIKTPDVSACNRL